MKIYEGIKIRRATEADVKNITALFYQTIQNINIQHYSREEVNDWSASADDFDKWKQRISDQYFILAILNKQIVGFASLAKDGYLDFMFTHKDYQGRRIATAMLLELENKAVEQYNRQIYSDVSITAKNFFISHGYKVIKQQVKKANEKEMINFRMIKPIY